MALITQTELQQDRFEPGDAALVLKFDGSFRIFNFNQMTAGVKMTPRQLEQGTALAAFALLLRMPEMMEIVASMATDPEFAGLAADTGLPN